MFRGRYEKPLRNYLRCVVYMRTDRLRQLSGSSVMIVALVCLCNFASFGQCPFPTSSALNVLSYSFEPIIADNKMKLLVTLAFNGGPKGHVKLELPSEWAGQQHADKSITELRALSEGTTIADTESPAEKEVTFSPNAAIRISYVLAKDWDGPLNSSTRFRTDLSPDYFHIIGTTSLVHPEINDWAIVDVHFDWQKLPAEWSLATSFGTDNRCQSFHGPWRLALHSLFVGGDYRVYRTTLAGNALGFAIRGKWGFTDDDWVSQVRKIVEFERGFWHDNAFPYFLVTLTPLEQETGSSGGTALTAAFMMHLSKLDRLTPGILGIIAHETFHGWNPQKIGQPPGSGYLVSWFYEGFTAHYQDLMLLHAGLITFPDYVEKVNEKLKRYELSAGTGVSLQEFVRQHSANKSVLDDLDQRRGAVLANWLDATIRKRTSNKASLDNLMLDLAAQGIAYQRRHSGNLMALTNKRLFRAATRYIGREPATFLRHYVELGGSIPVPVNALGPCVRSHTDAIARFDPGFDLESVSSENKTVSGVEPDSEAYRAGLRDGQELAGWSVYKGDTSKQIKLKIKGAEGQRVIEYFPLGKRVPVQQFTLDSALYASDPQSCAAVLQSRPPAR
jgi:predicted metalloprotease with PDZ domain